MKITKIVKYIDTQSSLYRFIYSSPLHRLGKYTHNLLVNFQLLILSLNYQKHSNQYLDNLTIIIKTFNRPKELRRLLKSIDKFYPNIKIIIANDGAVINHIGNNIKLLNLEFDSGVSYGRNRALAEVKTPYFLCLDDDFIFYHRTNIQKCLEVLIKNPQIDLVGGEVINLPFFRVSKDGGKIYLKNGNTKVKEKQYISSWKVCEKVPQFFIARTDKIRAIGWDNEIKRLDHGVFFTRLKGHVVSVYNPNFSVLHARTPFNKAYLKYRLDFDKDLTVINQKYFQLS